MRDYVVMVPCLTSTTGWTHEYHINGKVFLMFENAMNELRACGFTFAEATKYLREIER